jgi:hypothetical protein
MATRKFLDRLPISFSHRHVPAHQDISRDEMDIWGRANNDFDTDAKAFWKKEEAAGTLITYPWPRSSKDFWDQFLNAFSKEVVSYEYRTSLDLLTHLLTYYAVIAPTELIQNYERLDTPYDPNQPIET